MATVASRDLRNHTAEVLRRVSGGTRLTITVNGQAVAELGPVRSARPRFFTKSDLLTVLGQHQADPELADDLARLAGDTTDDLDPL
jgi:prevent-host-death family protein